jgi:hypothetical protein
VAAVVAPSWHQADATSESMTPPLIRLRGNRRDRDVAAVLIFHSSLKRYARKLFAEFYLRPVAFR